MDAGHGGDELVCRVMPQRCPRTPLTESALARWTGCFRPAVRTFFAQRAAEIEAHNHKHHLLPGLDAARGRRDQQIEQEVRWRGEEKDAEIAEPEE